MFSPNSLLRNAPAMLYAIALLLLIALATLGVRSWIASRDAAVQLMATVAAQKKIIDQASAHEQQRQADLAKTLAGIARAKREVQTPAQIVEQIPQILPPLPEPLNITLPERIAMQPALPAVANVPQADLKPLYDYLQDCRACQAKLSNAQGDLNDERTKVAALITERDAATKAAKGGPFWTRVKHGAKWFIIGGALGALAAGAARH